MAILRGAADCRFARESGQRNRLDRPVVEHCCSRQKQPHGGERAGAVAPDDTEASKPPAGSQVAGFSGASIIAQELAPRDPELVSSLVMQSTWPVVDTYPFLDAFVAHDTSDRLPAIAAPTLVLAGRPGHDRSPEPCRGSPSSSPAPGRRDEQEADQPSQERPDEWNARVEAFWREVEGRS